MTVLMAKSVCRDCIWRKSCQKFERLNGSDDQRDNPGHAKEIFEIIVLTCSTKNCDRSYKTGKEDGSLYYCTTCEMMHHSNSRIGIVHKKIQQKILE